MKRDALLRRFRGALHGGRRFHGCQAGGRESLGLSDEPAALHSGRQKRAARTRLFTVVNGNAAPCHQKSAMARPPATAP